MAGIVNEDTLYPSTRMMAYPNADTGYKDSILVEEKTDVALFKQNNYGYTLNEFVDLIDSTENFNYNLGLVTKPTQVKEYPFRNDSDVPVVDQDWVSSRFMISSADLTEKDAYSRFNTRADWKFESTGWGCHHVINPLPQFTRYCDIRRNMVHSGMRSEEGIDHLGDTKEGGTIAYSADLGMGRYYSEAIDDHSQYVYMQFGTPEFNSMLSFFRSASYYQDTYIATHGRYPLEFDIAKSVSAFMVGKAYPFTSLFVFVIKTIYKTVTSFSPFSYYYLNPNMHMYWGNVNSIVTSMAVELGMLSPLTDKTFESLSAGQRYRNKTLMAVPVTFDQNDIEDLKMYLPDVFPTGFIGPDTNGSNGNKSTMLNTNYIDVYALATRHTRRVTAMRKAMLQKIEAWDTSGDDSYARAALLAGYVNNPDFNNSETKKSLKDILEATRLQGTNEVWDVNFVGFLESIYQGVGTTLKLVYGAFKDFASGKNPYYKGGDFMSTLNVISKEAKDAAVNEKAAVETNKAIDLMKKNLTEKKDEFFSNILTTDDFYNTTNKDGFIENMFSQAADVTAAVQRDGGMFAGFRVEYTGEASDSFSNSTSPLELGNIFKSATGTVRNIKFSLAGGNLVPGLDSVLSVAKNIIAGGLDGATFGLSSVIMSALSGAFVDFPEKWEESSVNLHTANYNIKLIAPYGNMISQLQNIYIPLAMLLAGALPLAVGKSSHTSPMICNLFSKGVQNIELGIITDISITRGTSNLPFDSWRRPLAIDVSFTVKDLSPIVAVPINKSIWTNFVPGNLSNIIPDLITEGGFDKYIGTLCARDLYGMRFYAPQFFRNLRKASMRASQSLSITNKAFGLGETLNFFSGLFVRDYTIGAATQNNKF